MEEENTTELMDVETYLKSGIHIGTKFKTKHMAKFIYKTRPDGLSVLDIDQIDKRLKMASQLLAYYEPQEVLLVSRRENGWKPLRMLNKITGMRVHAGRYPPGMLTNPDLQNYTEAKLLFVVDAWPDRNAIQDALRVGIPVVALCDTNNLANNIDFIVPCNNKGKKSLALVFWILSNEYQKIKTGSGINEPIESFMDA